VLEVAAREAKWFLWLAAGDLAISPVHYRDRKQAQHD